MNQPPNGFWAQAAADPDRTVLIAPDGEEWSAGRLHADVNRMVHGLRAAGLREGDALAVVLPNGVELLTAHLAASQAGFYLVPVNHHLVGPEIAWIVADSGARVLIAHERFAAAATAAADEAELPATHRYGVGTVPGCRPYAELLAGHPATEPDGRTLGWVMNYTSGTTGRPRGIRRPLPGKRPEETYLGGFLGIFGIRPFDGNVHLVCSPLYHTAVLQFASAALHIGHPLVLMDGWSPEEMLRLIDTHRCTHTHMVPTQFHRLLALPDEVKARYDVSSVASTRERPATICAAGRAASSWRSRTGAPGRERWWKSAHRQSIHDPAAAPAARREAGRAYTHAVALAAADRLRRAANEVPLLPPEWLDASTYSDFLLHLTPGDVDRMRAEIFEVVSRYRRGADEAPEGAARVALHVHAFPVPDGNPAPAADA
ncbi:2-succinylbenzoate--CoA ligase [Streptomyces griseus subsp. griseus]